VSIYIKHNDNENDKGKGVLVNQDRGESVGIALDEKAYFSNED